METLFFVFNLLLLWWGYPSVGRWGGMQFLVTSLLAAAVFSIAAEHFAQVLPRSMARYLLQRMFLSRKSTTS